MRYTPEVYICLPCIWRCVYINTFALTLWEAERSRQAPREKVEPTVAIPWDGPILRADRSVFMCVYMLNMSVCLCVGVGVGVSVCV